MEIYHLFTAVNYTIPTPSFPNLIRLDAYSKSIAWFLASAHKLPVLTDIGILFEVPSGPRSWEISAISRIRRDVHVSFIILSHSSFHLWVESCFTGRISRKHVIQSLLNVTNVTLRFVWTITEDFKTILVSWLALFPSLRVVNIIGSISGVDWKNPQNDFIKLVTSTCPRLQVIGMLQ